MATDIKNDAYFGDGLLAFWEFNGNSQDSTANNHDGTDTNISYGSDGTGTYAYNLSKNGKIDTGSWELPASYTVAGWVKMDSITSIHTFFSTYNGGGTGSAVAQAYLSIGTGELGYSNFAVDIGWSATKIDTGNWHSVIYTHDGTTARVYLDSTEVKNGSCAHATTTAVFNLMSRGDETTQRMDGYIGGVGVWNKKFSTTNVTDFHNSGTRLPYEATTSINYSKFLLLGVS